IRLLAIDFGSPQLFSLANVSVIPVSVSAPQNVRVNIANTHYQIFQWDLPTFGIPERFRLILKRKPSNKNEGENKLILHQRMIEPTETITMTRVRLLPGEQVEICIWSVDAEGETPSEIINFQTVENAPQCDGQCSSPNVGLPMCYFSSAHYLRQFRDSNGNLNCLCFAGFSGPQCDKLAQRVLEQYGGVDWPETAVNNSAFVPCPYNEDGRRLERSCGWDSQTETPIWATASQQISKQTEQRETGGVLVHLGVLANYGQRNEQTLSGLQSVMRFLSTLLQFPAFQSNIHSAHFDAKIAEHVAQVLDVLATKNFSALGGMGNNNDNSSRLLRRQIADYTKEFARRLPNPFLLQSPSGGLQMRVWDILPSSSTSSQLSTDRDLFDDPNIFLEDKKEENSLKEDEDDDGGVQIGSCFVQPPKGRRNNYARIARAVCFKNATIALFPTLDEFEIISGNPVLMLEVRKSRNGQKKKRNEDGIISNPSTFPSELTEEISEENRDREPLLVGFRLPSISMSIEDEDNHTCAHYDYNAQIWSISGVVVLSRESRPNGQILLCEVHGLKSSGVFAALPDRLFARTDLGLAKAFLLFFENFGPTISAAFTIVLSLVLLFSFSIFKRLWVKLRVQTRRNISDRIEAKSLLKILDFRDNDLVLGLIYKPRSNLCHVLPLSLSVLTLILDGQILEGLDSDDPHLQPFNWIFGLFLLLPLIISLGIAMGFGAYSFWYANRLLAASFSSTTVPTTSASNWPTDSLESPSHFMQHLFSRRHPNNQFNTSNNQLTPTPVQQRFSGTISTSIGAQDSSVMDSLGSLDDEKEGILISEEWGRNAQLRAKFFGLIPNNEEIIYADEDDLLIFSNGTNNLGRREKHPNRKENGNNLIIVWYWIAKNVTIIGIEPKKWCMIVFPVRTNKETRMEHGPREYLSFKDIGIDFCARTSSHGIPFVGTHSFFGRPFWATVTAIAFCSFIIQTYYTLSDYLEFRTIIEMQLKFEPAPFPAATICVCTHYNDQCVPQQYFPDEHNKNSSVCLCYEDQQTGDIWPCYAHFVWKQKHCSFCSHSNTCDDPDLPNNKTNIKLTSPSIPCLCQPISHYCIKDSRKLGQDFKWWNPHNYTIYPFTTRPPPSELEEAFGLEVN
uniref:Fibronectin type-III domain-containing protein n=1 Tax=Meloidogyne javanica TaxID=6303 RepID=A0A915LJ19_MELJA